VSDDRHTEAPGDERDSVFGKLPDSRPGTRSPRRRGGSERVAKPAPKSSPAKSETTPKRRPQDAPHQEPEPPLPRAAGLEDLAWAGVAVAAEAATLGVRLASRAVEAMRGTTERE
jgi:hypothetical protein